ncbi:hypothetical protein BC830DRAFT_562778 [Chytriomyces sp. MP71]|nr:hypothetical protein BC830DRAFT_562778 [Chytriomyces sp. MP71]
MFAEDSELNLFAHSLSTNTIRVLSRFFRYPGTNRTRRHEPPNASTRRRRPLLPTTQNPHHVTQVSTGAFDCPDMQGDKAVRLVNGTLSTFRSCFATNASMGLAQDISTFWDPDSLSDAPAEAEIQRMNPSLVGAIMSKPSPLNDTFLTP